MPVCIELIDLDEERPAVFDAKAMFVFEHLREVIEGTFAFEKLVIPEPGEYRLKLYVADRNVPPIISRVLGATPVASTLDC